MRCMEQLGNIKVLFIAGFGPIVREATASRKLYNQILGIGFKEEKDGYLHTEALKGANSFALWPLSQAAQSCFGKDSWPLLVRILGPIKFPRHRPGSSSTLTVSKRR